MHDLFIFETINKTFQAANNYTKTADDDKDETVFVKRLLLLHEKITKLLEF